MFTYNWQNTNGEILAHSDDFFFEFVSLKLADDMFCSSFCDFFQMNTLIYSLRTAELIVSPLTNALGYEGKVCFMNVRALIRFRLNFFAIIFLYGLIKHIIIKMYRKTISK